MPEPLLLDGLPFTVELAATHGISERALRTLVDRGQVRRLLRGVYADAHASDTLQLRAQALILVSPPGRVVCRGTAAWLFGVPPVEPNRHVGVPALELMSESGQNGTRRRGCLGSSGPLAPDDVIEVRGVVATSGRRTCLDLARDRERPDALAYVDALVRAGAATRAELLDALPTIAGLPWAEQGREIVELCDPGAESPGESWLRLRHLDAGFPWPRTQLWVSDDAGVPVVRLDLGLADRMFAEEYDGEAHHGAAQQPRDLARKEWLERRGWVHRAFGKAEVLGRGYVFERVVGEALGIEPRCLPWEARRRTYARRRRTPSPPDLQ
ncbi:MAG TPA: type IV toxin-antitoxin system AbiEi family antitoxin domain-containing protein [Actinomycetes bacterium]